MFERNIFWHALGSRLRGTLGFAIAAVAISAMYLGVFPSFQDQMAGYAEAIPEGMSAFMGNDFASPAGYVQSTVFTILGPLLTVAAAVSWAAAAIAGEEEAHTLPLLATAPVSRLRLAAQKFAAVLVTLTILALVLLAALLAMSAVTGMDLAPINVLAAVAHLHGLGFLAMGVALGVGAATGRRVLAIGTGAGVVTAGFVLSGVSGLVESLADAKWFSPFYWSNGSEPIRNGVDWPSLALLYGVGVVAAGLGVWRFNRRDLH
jgi:ABC-2 type transport system permease protein